ncbi:hypothetical protein DSO57_1012224 [Entomophthora muscae]|uniref:Uncharacterized protein n=1 Tax=Entomophthora muscae TaxID=34485 RepID=A0ACC2RKR5_9FUNG|nr:hypothetical protein DSO57_1012224 [Entomophthora muscae]
MDRVSFGIKLVGTHKEPCQRSQTHYPVPAKRKEKETVRNIPDNKLCQDKILCAIDLKSQDKKLQQIPLIGETATKQPADKKEFKNLKVLKSEFYTPAADCAASCQLPACQPNAQPGILPAPASQSPSQPAGGGAPPTVGLSTPTGWGNCQIRKPKKGEVLPKFGAYQIWMGMTGCPAKHPMQKMQKWNLGA